MGVFEGIAVITMSGCEAQATAEDVERMEIKCLKNIWLGGLIE